MIYLEGIYTYIYISKSRSIWHNTLFPTYCIECEKYIRQIESYICDQILNFFHASHFLNKGKSLLLCPFNKLILSCYVGSCGLIFFFTWGLLRVSSKRHIVWSNWYHIFMIAKSNRHFLWIELAAPKKKNTCNWYQRVIIF